MACVAARSVLCLLVCFALSEVSSGLARAEAAHGTAASEPEARRAFDAGRDAYERGAFADALAHFERAYALSKRPGLLFNIARAADSDSQLERAIEGYRSYLEVNPGAENRAFVEARITKLRALAGRGPAVTNSAAATNGSAAVNDKPPPPTPLPSVAASMPEQPRSEVAPVLPTSTRRDEGPQPPFWKRGWFWGVVGTTIAGGVTASVLATRDRSPDRADANLHFTTPEPR